MISYPTDGPFCADDPQTIAEHLFESPRRVLLVGEAGAGKSTLAAGLARWLAHAGIRHRVIGADPGSPAFGIPGSVCLGRCEGRSIRRLAVEALCSLDAARFRLPLIQSVRRLAAPLTNPFILIDGPGLTRGVAAAELLSGLIDAAGIDTLLTIRRQGKPPPLTAEIDASGLPVVVVAATDLAHPPAAAQRQRARTALWDAHLDDMPLTRLAWHRLTLIGTPPPVGDPAQWNGRQVALLHLGRTLAMGEVVSVDSVHLTARLPEPASPAACLLVRDAGRIAGGGLGTRAPLRAAAPHPVSGPTRPAVAPASARTLGNLTITSPNGVFGNPLLHLRLANRKRSLLMDIGDGSRLPARIAHQVSDVFITHAHIDHIGGFFWLLRSRIGDLPRCRLYGPPGISGHIAGMIDGIRWDRIGRRAPLFDVVEVLGDRLVHRHLRVGTPGMRPQGERCAADGCLIDDPAFTVQAVVVDHGIPVLALAYVDKPRYHIREHALRGIGWPPGPWLGELKRRVAAGQVDEAIHLPDGRRASVAELADALVRVSPGKKLVYATDVADTPANRRRLITLARGADLFFCEAAFIERHRRLAAGSGHLTARACGEIAAAAGVTCLVPLHLSRRYERRPEQVYDEIREACAGRVAVAPW